MSRVASLIIALLIALPVHAQLLRPQLAWRTIETEHFVFHFPAELEPWTRHVAERMESVRERVVPLVGSAPRQRTTVIVDDPYNQVNGMAYALIATPTIYLWPNPPDPRSMLGNLRSFPEELAVHEYAHVAHLTRPSRQPVRRLIALVVPGARDRAIPRPPRWVTEGYATYVEGLLTGSGRPHGVYRPSVLRQWALEGRLPTYGQLNGSGAYQGDAFAYLAGSAFIEWLAAKRGDSSLVLLWRRMSARQRRSFDDAFAGVYGGLPADLYGRFTVELTASALEAQRAMAATGADSGAVVQRLDWSTGNPTLSADGKLIALVVRRAPNRPGRIEVWETAEAPDTMAARRRERALKLDPEDVPAIEWRPAPKRAVSTLAPRQEREFAEPRFLADGNRLLVVRSVARPDGSLRPALFVWDRKARRVEPVRGGDGLNYADPSPDGRQAIGTRCLNGSCDLVRLDLVSGAVATLARGGPATTFHRPRYSPDGRAVAVAVHERGLWRVALFDANALGRPRWVGLPDSASRYEPAFTRDGEALMVVSERGGVANIERIDLATDSARTLTQATGAAVAPEPAPDGGVYFLTLHAKGYDLRRLATDSAPPVQAVMLDARLTPAAARPAVAADTPQVRPVGPTRRYAVGPRRYRLIPTTLGVQYGSPFSSSRLQDHADYYLGAGVASADPVGRLTWLAQGVVAPPGPWRGASLNAAWRGSRPGVFADLFYADHRPSRLNSELRGFQQLSDIRYAGATVGATLSRQLQPLRVQTVELGLSAGRQALGREPYAVRRLAFASYAGVFARRGGRSATAEVALEATAGDRRDTSWMRGMARLALSAPVYGTRLFADGLVGRVTNDAPLSEWLTFGGLPSPLASRAVFAQQVAIPALPAGAVRTHGGGTARVGANVGQWRVYYAQLYAPHAGRDVLSWYGLEQSSRVGAIPFLRVPAIRTLGGVAMTVEDEVPWRRVRGYLTIQVTP